MSDPKDARCKKPIIDFFLLVSSAISMKYILLKETNSANDIMDWRLEFSERIEGYPIISWDVGATILWQIDPQLKMDWVYFIQYVHIYSRGVCMNEYSCIKCLCFFWCFYS